MLDGSARVEFPWGTEVRAFRLGMKELRKLQSRTGFGPEALRNRILTGQWNVDDLRETILQGLMGEGMKAEDAGALVEEFVDGRPLIHSKQPALIILGAALIGPPDDIAKKDPAAGQGQTQTASTSEPSSEMPLQSE